MGRIAVAWVFMVSEFLFFAVVGFFAQLADGTLGMGFGVVSSAILLGNGVSPPLISAAVNAAKIPTGAAAGLSHWRFGNIDWKVFVPVALTGAMGGIFGALVLAHLKGDILVALVAGFLIMIGGLILFRAIRGTAPSPLAKAPSGLIGGIGGVIEGIGGSWGPVVTTGLLGAGHEPRKAVGSSALAELVVSLSVFLALFVTFHQGIWGEEGDMTEVLHPVAGLVAGGIPAAFAGGWLASRAPKRMLTFGVASLAIGIGTYRLWGLL